MDNPTSASHGGNTDEYAWPDIKKMSSDEVKEELAEQR